MKGLRVSNRWYLGCLKGQLGGAGHFNCFGHGSVFLHTLGYWTGTYLKVQDTSAPSKYNPAISTYGWALYVGDSYSYPAAPNSPK